MGWYIVTTNEMREAGLKGNDLTVFAVLWGYSQEGDGCYYGGQKPLAERCGISPRTLRDILNRLEEQGFITREEIIRPNGKYCAYGVRQILPEGCGRNCRKGAADFAANNKIKNKDNNMSSNEDKKKRRIEKKSPIPTFEEVREYCESRRNNIDPAEFVEHYTSNGWMVGKVPMADWKAAVRTWERRRTREATRPSTPTPSSQKGDYFLEGLKTLDRLNGTHHYEDYMNQINGGPADEK